MAQSHSGSLVEAEDTPAVSSCHGALICFAACWHHFVVHRAPRPPTRRSQGRRILIHRRGFGLTEESRYAELGRSAFIADVRALVQCLGRDVRTIRPGDRPAVEEESPKVL